MHAAIGIKGMNREMTRLFSRSCWRRYFYLMIAGVILLVTLSGCSLRSVAVDDVTPVPQEPQTLNTEPPVISESTDGGVSLPDSTPAPMPGTAAGLPYSGVDNRENTQGEKPDETAEPQESADSQNRNEFGKNLFVITDHGILWLSIPEETFIEYAKYLKRELRINDAAVCGVLANIQGESGFSPTKVGDGGDAFGICQWRGSRLDQMVEYCEANDLNPVSIEGQLAYLVHDLKEVYIYPYDLLLTCSDSALGAVQATYNFCAYYEVPASPENESPEREIIAKELMYPTLCELRKNK